MSLRSVNSQAVVLSVTAVTLHINLQLIIHAGMGVGGNVRLVVSPHPSPKLLV